ncbi:MAG: glutamate--tRNA ligase [Deltaproteobacteria bacterium RIFCSPLOWO2_02_FULL_44_10]|nr:MAG: glutamate--tRNA ligase [Deltaproteobacteria bacterium RIFCSPHIGHO2_02_FULL_44_16]OGQ46046.1 MAG: glutamate--tRNA ligase [Deltaproteobacteria bacterium RIFCSPLOWO2_02_FULL_44_10]
MTQVKVRFAPSPTGSLHIGGARTALYNWLFARHHGGSFLLRIEDTDWERSTKEFEQSILDGMRWLGLTWDGDPIYQSARTDLYKDHIARLVAEGKAYYCTCTKEELEAKRQKALASGQKPKYDGTCRNKNAERSANTVVRFRAPEKGVTSFNDLCRGEITFENSELDDLVIARADGSPTYNLTVVVDDALMGITHIIRGDDHIANTPRQMLLYQALGFPVPALAHLPMIYGADKKKLSKRHGAVSVVEYEQMGFLPDAMINYLARLGWSHGDQEIFSRDELVQHFHLDQVGSSPAVFDREKLRWVNSQHQLRISDSELAHMVRPFLEKMGLKITDHEYAAKAIRTEKERGRTLEELAQMSAFYFRDEVIFDEKAVSTWLNTEGKALLHKIKERLQALETFDEAHIAKLFESIMTETDLKMVKLAQPCRVALCGTTISPGIYEVIAILGKEKTLQRLERALSQ